MLRLIVKFLELPDETFYYANSLGMILTGDDPDVALDGMHRLSRTYGAIPCHRETATEVKRHRKAFGGQPTRL